MLKPYPPILRTLPADPTRFDSQKKSKTFIDPTPKNTKQSDTVEFGNFNLINLFFYFFFIFFSWFKFFNIYFKIYFFKFIKILILKIIIIPIFIIWILTFNFIKLILNTPLDSQTGYFNNFLKSELRSKYFPKFFANTYYNFRGFWRFYNSFYIFISCQANYKSFQ